MKKILKYIKNHISPKISCIKSVIAGEPTLYFPVDDIEQVGYVHVEVISKNFEELCNQEINFQDTESQQK